jgi:cation diffusion facilitator CzcD-associated flavoprotein CzcO
VRVEERVGGKGWKVVLRKWNEEGEACDIQEVWDAVVVASGCSDFPMWPDTPGLTEARDKGLIKHAKWWTGPEDYEGKVWYLICVWFAR